MFRSISELNSSLTFSDYFKLNVDVDFILASFGYSYENILGELPHATIDKQRVGELATRIEESLPYINLTDETARREFLIAPVLLEVVHYTKARVRVEFPLKVSDQLQGTLDYLLQAKNNLLVIEAKNADLQKGFTQLAVELIALDQWTANDIPRLYGAISIGDIWRFGMLDRPTKKVIQGYQFVSCTR